MPSLPDAVVLCGGAGTRLRSVTGEAPKSMASIAGRPFLELLLRQLGRHGFERAILAVGYQKDVIQSYFGEQAMGLTLAYSVENSPLGTGGALRNAAHLIHSGACLLLNGDSYTDADLSAFVAGHLEANADVSLVVVPADGRSDCGNVLVDPSGKVTGFAEKEPVPGSAFYVNAGIYLIARRLLEDIPAGVNVSLEREVFPRWLAAGKRIRALLHRGVCIDIGTPERYQAAQQILAAAETDSATPAGRR